MNSFIKKHSMPLLAFKKVAKNARTLRLVTSSESKQEIPAGGFMLEHFSLKIHRFRLNVAECRRLNQQNNIPNTQPKELSEVVP